MPYDFDVVVIGSGAGGATFAHACALAHKRVLLIERGGRFPTNGQAHDENAMLIEKRPYDDRAVRVNGQERRLYTGGVLGGGTALYGAALVRPSADDFHPGRHYGPRLSRALWDWPVNYGDLDPFYTEAEHLYGVAGSCADDFGALGRPSRGFPHPPSELRRINRQLITKNRSSGLKPFHLPLAINFQRCLQCHSCPGFICPNGARRSSAALVDEALTRVPSFQLMTNVEAECFCKNGENRVTGLQVRDRRTGQRTVYRAQRYALAAGAIGSPTILLKSAIGGPHVGQNYMYHVAPIAAGIFAKPTEADTTFVKQVGFADYYLGSPEFRHKLGLIQSLPVPGPLMMAKSGGRGLPRSLRHNLRKRMLPLVGIVEDLPNPANRVVLGADGAADLQHSFSPYDVERGRVLGKLMKRILKRAGALFCISRPFPSEEHVAHQCGTLRFGKSPQDAVVDASCRLFDQSNVFVVDGSIFPTSLGVGPALTIMANALRVARIVLQEI